MKTLLINGLSFQLAWWALVLWSPYWWAILLAFLIVHGLWVLPRPWLGEVRLALLVALTGAALDSLWFATGLLSPGPWLPAWLAALWLCFGLSVPHSLRWFIANPRLGIPLFALAGPLSYLAGMALTEVSAGWLWLPLSVLIWALFVPYVIWLRQRLAVR